LAAAHLYVTFIQASQTAGRTFTAIDPKPRLQSERGRFMDFVFIAAGIALFAAFAGYAALLRRI
jgi:hypothetical protein